MAMTEIAPPDVAPASPTQIATNLQNIQGNVFGGFFKDHQVFLFLRLHDADQAKAWLADLIDDIATAEEVIAFNNAFKLTRKRHHKREGVVKATWINVAFTFKGLKALGVSPEESFPDEFKKGMAAQAGVIGDVDDSAPTNWIPPLQVADPANSDDPNVPDAILLVASDDPEDLEAEVARLGENLDEYGIEVIYRQNGESRSGIENGENQRGHEHFGFDDGVSQPGVRDDRVTPPGSDPDIGLPGQDRLWPGEWVLGYPRQTVGEGPPPDFSPNTDPGPKDFKEPGWAEDGSYLVFRRLHQDVKGFRDFVDQQAEAEGITSSVMGAKIVGRYTSGCPLELADGEADTFDPTAVDPSKADPTRLDDQHINAFDYEDPDIPARDDKDGHRVPRAAHIRKVYPRNERPPTETKAEIRRILRRGIQFGESFDAYADPDSPTGADAAFPDDRGLCFLCYQSSIKEKFEFLMQFWVNNENFPQVVGGVKDGHDLVISQASAIRSFNLPGGVQPAITAPARWVITSGGGYFFQPSISGLQHLAGLV